MIIGVNILIFCEQGGDRFFLMLGDSVDLKSDSPVASFQNGKTVHLEEINPFTWTGITPGKFCFAFIY